MKVILMFRREADDTSMWIRETRACIEYRLEIADREDNASDAIKKDGVGEGEERGSGWSQSSRK